MVIIGNSVRLVDSTLISDPNFGRTLEQRFTGRKTDLQTLQFGFEQNGHRARLTETGSDGNVALVVTFGGEVADTPEEAVERWTVDVTSDQRLIWEHPDIADEIKTIGDAGGAAYKKELLDAAANGEAVPQPSLPSADKIYRYLIHSGEYYEERRITLARFRNYGVNFGQPSIDTTTRFYTPGGLTSTYTIPTAVTARLPSAPANVLTDYAWGWRLLRDSTDYLPATNHIEQATEWLWGMWPEVVYTKVT